MFIYIIKDMIYIYICIYIYMYICVYMYIYIKYLTTNQPSCFSQAINCCVSQATKRTTREMRGWSAAFQTLACETRRDGCERQNSRLVANVVGFIHTRQALINSLPNI